MKNIQNIILEAISGSVAYGLNTPQSDVDIRGVFILPKEKFFSLQYISQINNNTNDITFFELNRFGELLSKNNPNILELLYVPDDCVKQEHHLFQRLKNLPILSKLCKNTFAGYAQSQIQKAYGLNKKILNPQEVKRKELLDFCYISHLQGSMPAKDWLIKHNALHTQCGLVAINHFRDTYALFFDKDNTLNFRGIAHENSNEVILSSVPKGELPIAYLYCNHDGYSSYCKDYRQYWEWVEMRNPTRYENTLASGKNYDAKNMMHTFRLLDMAEEIATEHKVIVRRPNRDFLFKIRKGEFEYHDLVAQAEEKLANINALFDKSTLPNEPDIDSINQVLYEIREEYYK